MTTLRTADTRADDPQRSGPAEFADTDRVFVYDPTDPSRCGEVHPVGTGTQRSLGQALQAGRAVAFIPLAAVYSLDQAAEFLNLPTAAIRRAVSEGRLATTGPHALRIRFADLLAYRAELVAARRSAIEELSEIDRQLGLEG